MKLTSHGRYDYSPIAGRPVYDWPNGKRLAVYLGLNLEHFAFGEGLGAELAPSAHPDVLNYAWRDYGNRVGAWRLLELFEAQRWPASVLINTAMYDYAPELVAAFRKRGDEIVGHGRTNSERQGELDEAARARADRRSDRAHRQGGGEAARGLARPVDFGKRSHARSAGRGGIFLRARLVHGRPADLLRVRGGGRILAVPYPQEVNDIPAIVARKVGAEEFADMIVDAFDEMLEQAKTAPLVMGIALHAYLVGHPHRLKHLRRALAHIAASRDDIWITTAGAIAEHCLALPKGIVPGGA